MTISRRKKKLKRILDELLPQRGFSTNRGDFVHEKFKKLTPKQRRHSGWVTPKICGKPMMKYSEMIEQCLEPQPYWDDWTDYRDGWRHNSDKKHFFHKWRTCCFSEEEVYQINKKIKKQIIIRKAKKMKKIEQSPLYSLRK